MPTFLNAQRRSLRHRGGLPRTDVWPLAVVVFMLVCFYLASGRLRDLDPVVELPTSSGSGCGPEASLNVTINRDNRIFFSMNDRSCQAAVIEYVAARRGIHLTAPQRRELENLPYIGTDVRNLPVYFSLTQRKRSTLMSEGTPFEVGEDQLSDFIDAARTISIARKGQRFILCAIRADKRIYFYRIRSIVEILQQCDVHRFNLKTNMD